MSPSVSLDHLLLGAPDLAVGVRDVEALLGVAPAPGGVHPTLGTANALLSLGEQVYLEVLAPAPGEDTSLARQLAALEGPAIQHWAARADDLDAVAVAASAAGLEPWGPIPGSRRTPDGELLAWRVLPIAGHDLGNFVPFFIDWGATAHPAMTSPGGPRLIRFGVTHPRAAELRRVYAALGLDIEVADGPAPRMTAEIDGAKGRVVLTGP